MSDDLFQEMVQFLQTIQPDVLPQKLEKERTRLLGLALTDEENGDNESYLAEYLEPTVKIMYPDDANGADIYEEIEESQVEDRRDYNTIMSRAIKAGPLLMKIALMRWKKVTAAVLDTDMFIYKEKSDSFKSPEFVIGLCDAEVKMDPRKDNKFIVTSTAYKNGSYEFKGSNARDRATWVTLLEEISQGTFGSTIDIENYDEIEQPGREEDLYEESDMQNIPVSCTSKDNSMTTHPPSRNTMTKKFLINSLDSSSVDNGNSSLDLAREDELQNYENEEEAEISRKLRNEENFLTTTQVSFKPLIESFEIINYDDDDEQVPWSTEVKKSYPDESEVTVIQYGEDYDVQTPNPGLTSEAQTPATINHDRNTAQKLRDNFQIQKSDEEKQVQRIVALPPSPSKLDPKIFTHLPTKAPTLTNTVAAVCTTSNFESPSLKETQTTLNGQVKPSPPKQGFQANKQAPLNNIQKKNSLPVLTSSSIDTSTKPSSLGTPITWKKKSGKQLFEEARRKCEEGTSSTPRSDEVKRKAECQIARRLLEKSNENSTIVKDLPKEEKEETEFERLMRLRREKSLLKNIQNEVNSKDN